jgi:membrane protein DedA with SNARE-associated domain
MEFFDWQASMDWLAQNPSWIGFAIGLTAFIESLALVGVVVPGVAILAALGALAGTSDTPLIIVLGCAMAGAIIGDGLSYLAGRYFRQPLLNNWPLKQHPQWYQMGESFIQKHGGKSIILGRFIGPVRPIVPMMAGMLKMPPNRYVPLNIFSAIAWAPFYLLPGYYAAQALQQSNNLWEQYGLPAMAAITGILIVWLWRHAHIRLQPQQPWNIRIQLVGVRLPILQKLWRNLSPINAIREFPLGTFILSVTLLIAWVPLQWFMQPIDWPYSLHMQLQPFAIGFVWALLLSFQNRRDDGLHLLCLLAVVAGFNVWSLHFETLQHNPLALSYVTLLLYGAWQICKERKLVLRQSTYVICLGGLCASWGWSFGWASLVSINMLSTLLLGMLLVCAVLVSRQRYPL